MSTWLPALIVVLVVFVIMGILFTRLAYKYPSVLNRKALAKARQSWWAIPGSMVLYPWVRLGNAIEGRVHREWHCEGEAVGCYEHGICSPDHEIHNPPCGWRS